MHPYAWATVWYVVFALFHSICAHEIFKRGLAKILGAFFVEHFWRLIYCVVSYWMLYSLFVKEVLAVEDYVHVIEYPAWLWNVMAIVKVIGLIVNYWAFVQLDYFEFWGLRQVWRGMTSLIYRRPWTPLKLAGVQRLEVKGIYHFCRHPALAGGFFFAIGSEPFKMIIVYTVFYVIYMLFGAYYEEKRLISHFGDQYLQYRREVGAFWPNSRQISRWLKIRPVEVNPS